EVPALHRFSKPATYVLMLVMLLSMMNRSMTYVIYEYDTQLFVDLFCINNNQPEMKCNGHCKLAQMKEEQKNEANKIINVLQVEAFYFVPTVAQIFFPSFLETKSKVKYPLSPQSFYAFLFTDGINKPPEFRS